MIILEFLGEVQGYKEKTYFYLGISSAASAGTIKGAKEFSSRFPIEGSDNYQKMLPNEKICS